MVSELMFSDSEVRRAAILKGVRRRVERKAINLDRGYSSIAVSLEHAAYPEGFGSDVDVIFREVPGDDHTTTFYTVTDSQELSPALLSIIDMVLFCVPIEGEEENQVYYYSSPHLSRQLLRSNAHVKLLDTILAFPDRPAVDYGGLIAGLRKYLRSFILAGDHEPPMIISPSITKSYGEVSREIDRVWKRFDCILRNGLKSVTDSKFAQLDPLFPDVIYYLSDDHFDHIPYRIAESTCTRGHWGGYARDEKGILELRVLLVTSTTEPIKVGSRVIGRFGSFKALWNANCQRIWWTKPSLGFMCDLRI